MRYRAASPVSGETFWSMLDRTAHANACQDGPQLAGDLCLDPVQLARLNAQEIARFGALIDTEPAVLTAFTPMPTAMGRMILNGEIIERKQLTSQSDLRCPECDVPSGAVLTRWSLRPIRICPLHGRLLQTPSTEKMPRSNVGTNASRYLLGRLGLIDDVAIDAPLLDLLAWHDAARTIEILGLTVLRIGKRSDVADPRLQNQVMEAGLAAGRTKRDLTDALDRILDVIPPAKELGIVRAYGSKLMNLFGRKTLDPNLAPIADIVREHALDHVAFRDDAALVRGCAARTRTAVVAAHELGVHPKTLGHILRTYNVPDYFVRHRLVPGTVFGDLSVRLADLMNQREMFVRYGLTVGPGKEVVAEGLVAPVYPCERHKRTYSAWDIERQIERLRGPSPVVDLVPTGLTTIAECGNALRRSFAAILGAMLDGRVEVAASLPPLRLDTLLVDPEAVGSVLLTGEDVAGLTLREVEERLGSSGRMVKALVEAGVLEARRVTNPIVRLQQHVVEPHEIERFEREYVLVSHMVRFAHVSFGQASSKLCAAGYRPIEAPLPSPVFRRSDFEKAVAKGVLRLRAEPIAPKRIGPGGGRQRRTHN